MQAWVTHTTGRARAAGVQLQQTHMRPWLRAQIVILLVRRREQWSEIQADHRAIRERLRQLQRDVDHTIHRLDRSPFRPDLTVHAAHARHEGVQAIFAEHGLPACPSCAVGADETLAEAAAAEGIDLSLLLTQLNRLLST